MHAQPCARVRLSDRCRVARRRRSSPGQAYYNRLAVLLRAVTPCSFASRTGCAQETHGTARPAMRQRQASGALQCVATLGRLHIQRRATCAAWRAAGLAHGAGSPLAQLAPCTGAPFEPHRVMHASRARAVWRAVARFMPARPAPRDAQPVSHMLVMQARQAMQVMQVMQVRHAPVPHPCRVR
jgi:hypothetical protein